MVHGFKDLAHEILLILGVKGVQPLLWTDVPPVADKAALLMISWQDDLRPLFFGKTLVELHRQRVLPSGRGGLE